MNNLLFSFVSSLNLRLSKCIKWYQKSEPNWERSLQRTRFKHRVPQRNPAASKCRRMFCKAQHNTTFPSNYIEFPQTGMKVMMHEGFQHPHENVSCSKLVHMQSFPQEGTHMCHFTKETDNSGKCILWLAISRPRKLQFYTPATQDCLLLITSFLKGSVIPFFP